MSILTGLGVMLSSSAGWAQQTMTAEDYAQQLVDAGNNTVAHLLEMFAPHVRADRRHLLTPTKIRVVIAADFNAFARYETREILIPAQLVTEIFVQAQALIYMKNFPHARQHYARWVEYLTRRSQRAMERFKAGKATVDDVPVMPLWTYAKLPAPPNLNQTDESIQQDLMTNAIGLILGHEIGHLVLGHQDYSKITPEQARRQEFRADDYAANLMEAAGLSVIPGAILVYSRFAFMEMIFRTHDQVTSTHPSGPCRLHRLISPEIEKARSSARSRRNMEAGSGMSFAQIESAMEALRSSCTG